MLRRIVNNNFKAIAIRRLSDNSCNNNNHRIVEELKEINRSLKYIYLNTFILNIVMCINCLAG
jgi:hypothetical protein